MKKKKAAGENKSQMRRGKWRRRNNRGYQELYKGHMDGNGLPDEWKREIITPIYKKGYKIMQKTIEE